MNRGSNFRLLHEKVQAEIANTPKSKNQHALLLDIESSQETIKNWQLPKSRVGLV